MSAVVPINIDGRPGLLVQAKQGMEDLVERARRESCMIDARLRTLTAEPEEGAATAEYAVVLIAATGFAALLVAILKSDAIKTLLTNIVKKALNVGCPHGRAPVEHIVQGATAAAFADAGRLPLPG